MIDRDLTEARALALLSRDQLGRDFFARGVAPKVVQIDTLPDLLAAYARIQRQTPENGPPARLKAFRVISPGQAPRAPRRAFRGLARRGE